MLTSQLSRPDSSSASVSRRAVLKAAAWSVPAVAVAISTPALAASGGEGSPGGDGGVAPIATCVTPGLVSASWSADSAQPQSEIGATGWTPANPSGSARNPVQSGAYAGDLGSVDAIGWASLHTYAQRPGFVSVNNRSTSEEETRLVVEQTYDVHEGFNYAFQIVLAPRSAHLAVQLVDVDVVGSGLLTRPASGAGITSGMQVLRVGVGNNSTHGTPNGAVATPSWLAKYPNHQQLSGEGERTFDFNYQPVGSDSVTIRYTMTLTNDFGSWPPPLQNADLWISMAQPVCA